MRVLSALLAGLLAGTGLTISGMVNPAVVLGFLDITGDWNPALLFVMVGALAIALPGYWLLTRRKPVFAERYFLPERRDIDMPLIAGAAIFGVGWGLAGICPGPALTMFGIRPLDALIFVAAMTAGMFLAGFVQKR
jgi:uncharacterized membrane protein YedE/YeeE